MIVNATNQMTNLTKENLRS